MLTQIFHDTWMDPNLIYSVIVVEEEVYDEKKSKIFKHTSMKLVGKKWGVRVFYRVFNEKTSFLTNYLDHTHEAAMKEAQALIQKLNKQKKTSK